MNKYLQYLTHLNKQPAWAEFKDSTSTTNTK